jgi:hypothetical protein
MIHPHHEAALWAQLADWFPPGSPSSQGSFGRGSFFYEGTQSPKHYGLTSWRMSFHNGIPLHGLDAPPEGVTVWWIITRPTSEAVAAAETLERGRGS